ncbi:MAG: hypothetical protein HQL29_02075 [Candidatus Omnitrophica bacterium]|nr:hypothetical protein [Candidatus Omnitrophota bacterium]
MAKKGISLLVVLVLCAVVFYGYNTFLKKGGSAVDLEFQKGFGYCTWANETYSGADSDASLKALKETGADHVSILVTWYQTNCWSGDIKRMEMTPSDESIIHAITTAHELGLKVMLKPHLDLLDNSDGSWRGEIGCIKETDWAEWMRKYTDYIMHYVEIAKENNVELFCVGTELSTAATIKGDLCEILIKEIRAKYSGALTYAAHWDRYQDIRFWKSLDYVGINAYFPLSEEMQPTYDELVAGWKKWYDEMAEFQKNINMPIIFPEIGCNSADGTAMRPWEHNPRTELNLELQVDYYKALLYVFYDKEWFYGLYWWYWGTNKNMGGTYDRSFIPQNKPSEGTVKEWYAKKISPKSSF